MGRNHLDCFVGKRQQMDKPRSQGEPRRLRMCFLASCILYFPLRACAKPSPHLQRQNSKGGVFLCLPRVKPCIQHPPEVFTGEFHSQLSCDHLFFLSPDTISLGSNAPTSSQSVSSQVWGIGRDSEVASERKVRDWEDRKQLELAEQLHVWTTGPSLNHSQLPIQLFQLHRYKYEKQGKDLTPPLFFLQEVGSSY